LWDACVGYEELMAEVIDITGPPKDGIHEDRASHCQGCNCKEPEGKDRWVCHDCDGHSCPQCDEHKKNALLEGADPETMFMYYCCMCKGYFRGAVRLEESRFMCSPCKTEN